LMPEYFAFIYLHLVTSLLNQAKFFIFIPTYTTLIVMRKVLQLTIILFLSLSFANFSQAQSCVPTNLNGTVIQLSCGNPCAAISVQVPHLKSTSDYALTAIPYNPFQYVVPGGTEDPEIYEDDQWSNAFNLPFNFCFYNQTYSQAIIGSNGIISFDVSDATFFNDYSITSPIPDNSYAMPSIMGMYTDLDPRRKDEPSPSFPWVSPYDRKIQWRVEGTAPCRRFIVSYYNVGTYQYDSTAAFIDPCFLTPNTFQIVMYESTGIIDVHVLNRSCFGESLGGDYAILGIQNENGTQAVAAPGKNQTLWTAQNEAFRFTPNGGASRFVSAEILSMGGTVLATGDTITTVQGLLDINFPNICPGPGATQYVVRTTFGSCPTGSTMVSLDTVTIQRNNTLPVTTTLVQPTCGLNSGSITVNVATGVGTTPYSYSLNGGVLQASNTFSGLGAGTYTVFATDASGCDTSYQVTLNAISNLTATTTFTNSSCPGASSGTMTVVPTSGVGPYTFLLNP
ncbi:MAG: hypothetical protein EOP51_29405, partial [Sphingobacteriales bacterium]